VHDLSARLGIHPQAAPHPWESSSLPLSLPDQISGSTLPNQNGPNQRKVPASHISRTTKDKTRSVCTCDISRDLFLSQSHSLARSLPRPTSQPTGSVENQAGPLRVKKGRCRCRCRCRTVLARPSVACASLRGCGRRLSHTPPRAVRGPRRISRRRLLGFLATPRAPRGLGAARPPRKRDRPCHPDEIFLSFFVSLR
jgi:hypothetical protein